jgi:hypothetical protein
VSFAERKAFFPPGDIVLLPILGGIAPGGGVKGSYKGGADAIDGAVATWKRIVPSSGEGSSSAHPSAITIGTERECVSCAIVVKYDSTNSESVF